METAAGLIKLKPNFSTDLEEWQETVAARRDEILEALRDEGVALESWFQVEVGGEPYLLWFMHARSIAEARETFLNSQREIDAFHMEKISKMAESQTEAVRLVDWSVDL